METRFKNSRTRLDRAYVHYRTIISEWNALLDRKSTTTVIRKDKDPRWNVVSFQLSPEALGRVKGNQLSLVLGEFTYQLRSALDGLIWDAITYMQNGTEPPSDAKG